MKMPSEISPDGINQITEVEMSEPEWNPSTLARNQRISPVDIPSTRRKSRRRLRTSPERSTTQSKSTQTHQHQAGWFRNGANRRRRCIADDKGKYI